MDMEELDSVVMELVVNAGNGRSSAIQAIREARAGHFAQAQQLLDECEEALLQCHKAQTDLVQAELQGEGVRVTLLMVHAQDHIMNAMTVRDIAAELIAMMKELRKEELV